MQFQADMLGRSVACGRTVEATALGGAYAAGLQSGFWSGLDALRAHWREDRRFEPQCDDASLARRGRAQSRLGCASGAANERRGDNGSNGRRTWFARAGILTRFSFRELRRAMSRVSSTSTSHILRHSARMANGKFSRLMRRRHSKARSPNATSSPANPRCRFSEISHLSPAVHDS